MPTLSNRFAGLKTSEAFKKIFKGDAIAIVDGSPEDLKLWKEAVNALHEDYQQLLTWGQEQQKSILKLRRQVGRLSVVCLLGVIFYGVSVYWVARHFHAYSVNQTGEIAELQKQLLTARAMNAAQKDIAANLEMRLAKIEQAQSPAPVPQIPVPEAAPAPAAEAK